MRPLLLALTLGAMSASCLAADNAEQKVRDALKAYNPTAQVDRVSPSPLPGYYEVQSGAAIVYVSADGKYMMAGDLYELGTRKDLTEARRTAIHKAVLDSVADDKHIVFAAKDQAHVVNVFTDIDCGYCRKLHSQIADYNKAGITVKYLFFPRAGLSSDSYKKAVSVWCSTNRNQALTEAKGGKDPDLDKTCSNPVSEEYELGMKLGVSGTPAIFAEDGSQIGGYMPPDRMREKLDMLKEKSQPTASN